MNNEEISIPHLYPMPDGVAPLVERRVMARLRTYAEHQVEIDRWYREGDGRPVSDGGRGYRFPYCIHGTRQDTAYDNICGPCEDGYRYWDAEREILDVYHDAVYDVKMYRKRSVVVRNAMTAANDTGQAFDADTLSALFRWAVKPMEG